MSAIIPSNSEVVYLVLLAIVLLAGLIFNSLVVLVMSRKQLRSSSVSVYLTAIAVADSLVLLASIPRDISSTLTTQVYPLEGLCVFETTLRGTTRPVAGWYVMALAIERFFMIMAKRKSDTSSRKKYAIVVVVTIAVGWVVGNLYNFWAWQLLPNGRCIPKPEYLKFKFEANIWILFTFSSFVPSLTLLLCNIPIAMSLYKTMKVTHNQRSHRALKRANYLVMLVSLTYLIFTIPSGVYEPLMRSKVVESNRATLRGTFFLLYLNHSLNFFLYVWAGPKFKKELKSMFTGLPAPDSIWSSGKGSKDKRNSVSTPLPSDGSEKIEVDTWNNNLANISVATSGTTVF